jgi:hypothetical protein
VQHGTEQLLRQQLILKLKGFYNGKLDGIWSAMTIEAKRRWENQGRPFTPGLPNNGLPFANFGPYPAGIRIGKDKLLTCAEVDQYLSEEVAKAEAAAASRAKIKVEPTVEEDSTK